MWRLKWQLQLRALGSIIIFFSFIKLSRAYTLLSNASLASLPRPGDDFDIHHGDILAPILQTRVPGTPGSAAVRKHFVDYFAQHLPLWDISLHNASFATPFSGTDEVPFVNIILRRDPPWARKGDVGRLVLAAHYDSKLTPEGFVGAIDSAAPCAMLVHAARSVDDALTRKWSQMQEDGMVGLETDTGVQIVLLDGEEAFLTWTDEDSIYGAR